MSDNCPCGHSVWDHYDGAYCLGDFCTCGPCELCGIRFIEEPVNSGLCNKCKLLKVIRALLKERCCVEK